MGTGWYPTDYAVGKNSEEDNMKHLSGVRACLLLIVLMGPNLIGVAQNPPGLQSSRLFCGTDATGFNGMNGQLAVVRTSGALVEGAVQVYNLSVPLNGITFSSNFLWAGQPENVGTVVGNTLRQISVTVPPKVLSTIQPGRNSFSASCCNEQMVVVNGAIYHAHYNDVIQQLKIDSSGKSEVAQTYSQSDVVGMATDGVKIWISKWSGRQVGTWDPTTNIFTPVFNTPSDAAALAWDVKNNVLWVGMADGFVIPYDATGKQLGNGFQPFGGENVDGLAFVPATTSDGVAPSQP